MPGGCSRSTADLSRAPAGRRVAAVSDGIEVSVEGRRGALILDRPDALGRAGEDQIPGQQGHDGRGPLDDLADGMQQQRGVGVLAQLAVDLGADVQIRRVDGRLDPLLDAPVLPGAVQAVLGEDDDPHVRPAEAGGVVDQLQRPADVLADRLVLAVTRLDRPRRGLNACDLIRRDVVGHNHASSGRRMKECRQRHRRRLGGVPGRRPSQ